MLLFLLVVTIILVHVHVHYYSCSSHCTLTFAHLVLLLLLFISSHFLNFHLVTFCGVMSCSCLFHCTLINFFAFMFFIGLSEMTLCAHFALVVNWRPSKCVSFIFQVKCWHFVLMTIIFLDKFWPSIFFDHLIFWSSSWAFEKNWSSLKQNFQSMLRKFVVTTHKVSIV